MAKRFLLCVLCLCLSVCMSACTVSLGSSQTSNSSSESNSAQASSNESTSEAVTSTDDSTSSASVDSSSSGNSTSSTTVVSSSSDTSPIKPTTENSEVVFVIDRSSGMCNGDGSQAFINQYGKTRLQVVQEAIMQSLTNGSFTAKDAIGIIYFGGRKNTPIKANDGKMMQAGNMLALKRAIELDISNITGGKNYLANTEWRHALEAATAMLQSTNVGKNQHIILITDGAPAEQEGESGQMQGYPRAGGWKYYGPTLPNGYTPPQGVPDKCYTDYLYDSKTSSITTSVINVGLNTPTPISYMKKMVTASKVDGKEHYYYTESADQIFNAVTNECKNIPNKIINEDDSVQPTFPDGTSTEAQMLILTISNIGSVTQDNFREKIEMIELCEESYSRLAQTQKEKVYNYQDLVNARAKYNEFYPIAVRAEFEQLVSSLPDATALKNADVYTVYRAKELLEQNSPYIYSMPNINDLNAKLTACYDKVLSSIEEETYIAQDGNGNGILEAVVTDMNGNQRSELTSPRKRGRDFAPVSNFFGIKDDIASGSEDCSHMYTDKKNPHVVKIWQSHNFSEPISFNVPTSGTLTIYARPVSSRTYTVSQNGSTLFSQECGDTAESCIFIVNVSSGNVTLGCDYTGYILALKFSYPNLG